MKRTALCVSVLDMRRTTHKEKELLQLKLLISLGGSKMYDCDQCIFGLCAGTVKQCINCPDRRIECTGNIYQEEAMRTAEGMYGDLLQNGVMGLCGESGECVDLVKKHLFQGYELDKEHLAKELGDVAWYLAVTAEAIGYDLNTILQMNVKKLRDRYPNGFDEERSKHRKEGDI